MATGALGYFGGKAVQTRVNDLPVIDMIEDTPLPASGPDDRNDTGHTLLNK